MRSFALDGSVAPLELGRPSRLFAFDPFRVHEATSDARARLGQDVDAGDQRCAESIGITGGERQ
jgi:hypothetical protein